MLSEKYHQITIHFNDTPNVVTRFHPTIKPPFDQISQYLYQSLTSEVSCTYKYKCLKLDPCNIYPIYHDHSIPTLLDVLNNIPYLPQYQQVHIFIHPYNYQIGNKYVSFLAYCVQTGMWVNKCHFQLGYGTWAEYTDPPVVLEHFRIIPKMDQHICKLTRVSLVMTPDQIRCKYPDRPILTPDQVEHMTNDDRCTFLEKYKCLVPNMDYPYTDQCDVINSSEEMLDKYNVIGHYNPLTNDILNDYGQIYAKFIGVYPVTQSQYSPHQIDAIATQLASRFPTNVFNELLFNEQCPETDDINKILIGHYQVSAVSVWEPIKK